MAKSLDLDALFKGFTERERRWTLAYIGAANFNATEAARIAGYATPGNDGGRLKRREHIVDAVGKLMAQRSEDLAIDAKWVLLELVEVQRDAKAKNDRSSNLKALDLIGKHVDVRAFREQHGLGGLNGEALDPNLPLELLSEEELDFVERISRKLYGAKAAAAALPDPASLSDRAGEGTPAGGG